MSVSGLSWRRILIGTLIGVLFLSAEFSVFWCFDFPEHWIPIGAFVFVGVTGTIAMELQRKRAMQPYWRRACTGFRWKRQFPRRTAPEIREFLNLFVDSFGFGKRRRCCFSPTDRVMDVYQALYPPGSEVDGMELESLVRLLDRRYALAAAQIWRADITLGELFARTQTKPA